VSTLKRKAQYTVEFVLIFPLIIMLLFGIIEFGMYYRSVYIVQDIAEEAASVASRQIVLDSMISDDITSNSFNQAAIASRDVVLARAKSLAVAGLVLNYVDLGPTYGKKPFALYEFDSAETKILNGVTTPIISLLVDYRNPSENGMAVQVVYQYKTLFYSLSFPLPGGNVITLLPKDINISSTKVQAYLNY